jgi:hypothetical protein
MPKYLILFLVIFSYFSCKQNYGSDFNDVKNEYYQALLKKWQDGVDWQEQDTVGHVVQMAYMCSSEIYDIVRKTMKEYYNIAIPIDVEIEYVAMGKQKEHWLVRVKARGRWDVWVLISRISRNILSTESYRSGRHRYAYEKILMAWESDSIELRWPNYNDGINENVDSMAATTIAVTTAAEHYGFEMLPIGVWLMGVHKEHWMVFCFPMKSSLSAAYLEHCYEKERIKYNYNKSGNSRGSGVVLYYPGKLADSNCPQKVIVLVSRENGHVLFME